MGKGTSGAALGILGIAASGAKASTIWTQLGMFALGEILSPAQTLQGARLTNLGVQISQEGADIPFGFGNWRQAGHIVWSSGLIESAYLGPAGGNSGGGKGAPQQIENYTYRVSLAIMLGEAMTRLEDIYMNQYAIYVYNSGDEEGFPLTWDSSGFWYGESSTTGTIARIYPGSIDQPIDSMMETAMGVGNWTNYPGKSMLYIEDLQLTTLYNNTVPTVTVTPFNNLTALSDVINFIGARCGYSDADFNLSALSGLTVQPEASEGFVNDSRRPGSQILQELCDLFHFDLVEVDFVLTAVLRTTSPVATLTDDQCRVYTPNQAHPDIPFTAADESSLPQEEEVLARCPSRNYEPVHRTAWRLGTISNKKESVTLTGGIMAGNRAQWQAQVKLAERWAGSNTAAITSGPDLYYLTCADQVKVTSALGLELRLLEKITMPIFGPQGSATSRVDPLAYTMALPADTAALEGTAPIDLGAIIGFYADTVPLLPYNLTNNGFLAGATSRGAFNTVDVTFGDVSGNPIALDSFIPAKATIGETTVDYTPNPAIPYDPFNLTIALISGTLASLPGTGDNPRGNLFVFNNGVIGRFRTAAVTGTNGLGDTLYTLSGISIGRYGSDDLITGTIGSGELLMFLTDVNGNFLPGMVGIANNPLYPWVAPQLSNFIGQTININWYTTTNHDPATRSFATLTYEGNWEFEPSPVLTTCTRDVSTGAITLEGYCRTRYASDANLLPNQPRQMTAELFPLGYKYQIVLNSGIASRTLDLYTSDDRGNFSFTITDADMLAAFGFTPALGTVTGGIGIVNSYGVGRQRTFGAF